MIGGPDFDIEASPPTRWGASRARRLALAAYVAVARSRWTRLCDARIVDRGVSRLWDVGLDEVLLVLKALEGAGVRAVIGGGWGVDALNGGQTRRHTDLDVFIVEDQPSAFDAATAALYKRGYRRLLERPADRHMPSRLALYDTSGHFLDLLQLDLQRSRFAELVGTDPFVATGQLGGRTVECLAPRLQLALHEGLPHLAPRSQSDVAKLRRLHRRPHDTTETNRPE